MGRGEQIKVKGIKKPDQINDRVQKNMAATGFYPDPDRDSRLEYQYHRP